MHDGAQQVQTRRRERHASMFRKAAAILGFATAATTLHAQPLEAPEAATHSLEASAPSATSNPLFTTQPSSVREELPKHLREGIASYYGTTQDRFGLVNTTDPLVRTLIKENGHSLSNLPEFVYAADYLSLPQATALHAKNPNKYRLITKSGKLYDSRTMVAAFDDAYVGKYVEVTAVESGKKAVFRIEDTGAYDSKYGRVIDVSVEGAKHLGIYEKGTGRVTLRLVRDANTS
jgi:rare lipoprotein A (peptidoglycan hydrolase)